MKPTEQEINEASRKYYAQYDGESRDMDVADLAFIAGFKEAISQMQPEWVPIDQYPDKEIPLVMRWHKFWKCPVAVEHRRAYSEPDNEWLDGTRDNTYSETSFEPFFQYLPNPPTK